MSLKTWVEEFYPITGKEAAWQGTQAALEHGLRKWQGVTRENLRRHGLVRDRIRLYELGAKGENGWGETFILGWEECGLCWIYDKRTGPAGITDCEGCPIAKLEEDNGTSKLVTCVSDNSSYGQIYRERVTGPEVLIADLEAALQEWKASKKGIEEWAQMPAKEK